MKAEAADQPQPSYIKGFPKGPAPEVLLGSTHSFEELSTGQTRSYNLKGTGGALC